MARLVEDVKVAHQKGVGTEIDEVHSHPAFAQISLVRTSGGHGNLYGSEFDHHGRITLKVATSTVRYNNGRPWHSDALGGDIIELEMSESQFATLITSMNMGSGTPCTLRRLAGKEIPAIGDRASVAERFGREMVETIQESLDRLTALKKTIVEMGLPKGKTAELLREVGIAHDLLKSNTPYLTEVFAEHMEETVEKAKMEISGYMQAEIARTGLEVLTGQGAPIAIAGEARRLDAPEDDGV